MASAIVGDGGLTVDNVARGDVVTLAGGDAYTGPTVIRGGPEYRRRERPGPGQSGDQRPVRIRDDVAVLMTKGDLQRTIGTDAGQMNLAGGGGFAAKGGQLDVKLTAEEDGMLNWGDPGLLPNAKTYLQLGHADGR